MAHGRQKAEWERTALLAAIAANPYRDTDRRPEPFTAEEFNPFADQQVPRPEKRQIKLSVQCLKALCEPPSETADRSPLATNH